MAKAKKPASTSKSTSQAPKSAADKEPTGASKPNETSSASKAAAAKSDKTASTTPPSKNTPKDDAAKIAKTTDTKASTPADSKGVAAKSVSAAKAVEGKTSSSKPEIAKSEPQKSGTDQTAAEKKAEPETSAAAKQATTQPKPTSGTTPATPAPPKPVEKSGSVFWPLVLGGVIAAALGFVASEMNVLNTRVDTTEMESTLSQQGAQIAALESAEPAAAPDLSGIEASIAALDETVASLEARLTELENRPVPTSDGTAAPVADYSEELAALQSSVEAQKAEIDRLLENALSVEEATAEAARRAAVQSALTKITAALNTGGEYDSALDDLSQTGVADVPQALAAPADSGVATLLSLQAEFPNTARAALAAARAAGVDGGDSGAVGFLRRQLGARSVEPREGSDPDAVLSRAEAAVREGRLTDALTEIDTLPPEAQAAMESWLSDARARVEAEAAVQDLSQRLTAN